MNRMESICRRSPGQMFYGSGNMKNKDVMKYRWLLQELISRDLKVKYRRSFLGYLWSILNPLLMMAILTVVFSRMFRFEIANYPVYLLAGQLIFTFFVEATTVSMQSVLSGASLIKKVYLPKLIFPLSKTLSGLVNLGFSLVALFIVVLATGTGFHITLVLLPLFLVYVFVFTMGVSLLVSTLVVFFRDTQYLYGLFLTALNYLTPIFYPVSMLPQWLQELMVVNPMYNYITMFRKIILYGQWPTLWEHGVCIAFSIGTLVLGYYVFKKKEKDFILYI